MKLKKLRQAKEKQHPGSDAEDDGAQTLPRARTATPAAAERHRARIGSRPQSAVEIPLSPVKDRNHGLTPKSPARVVLGIENRTARDVSLKRASSFHAKSASTATKASTGSVSLSTSQRFGPTSSAETSEKAPRPKSFSERIAESRLSDRQKQEKEQRIKKARSQGFGLHDLTSEDGSSRAGSSLENARTPFRRQPCSLV